MDPTPNGTPIPILRPRALRDGYSDNEIRRLRRNGTWASIRRGGYVESAGQQPMDVRVRHELLVRSTVPGLRLPAVVSHTSAAVLLGIPLWSTHLGIVHVTRPRPANGGRSGSLLCHSAAISPDEVMILNDLEITTPARTIVDLARTLPFEQSVVAADAALHMGLLTADDLLAAALSLTGAPRSRAALRVARFANGLSESVGESRSRVLMHRAGLPDPVLQLEVFDVHGRHLGRSDYGWRRGRVLGEFDGRVKYGRLLKPGQSPGDVVFDEKVREDALRDNGARMVRWIWAELSQPMAVVERIQRAIGSTLAES